MNTWEELDDYVERSIELIRSVLGYTEKELLQKDEIEFFKILRRAEERQKKQIAAANKRK